MTLAAEVTIMRDRYVRGWPSHEEGERAYPCSLETALTRECATDAHLGLYTSPVPRRLTSQAVGAIAITLHTIAFDVDDPTTHGTSEPASTRWREEQRARCERLEASHPGAFFYDTRGGYRIVYRLNEPSEIANDQSARRWRAEYAVIREYMLRRFGISVDPACSDWTRLFRLPHATREPASGPERRATYGDPRNIGRLHVRAELCDLEAARAASKAFREPRSYAYSGAGGFTQGLLFHALRARGDVLHELNGSAFVIRCPNHEQHTSGRIGDGLTVLYPPAPGAHVGAINCLHAHCTNLSARDWVRLFTRAELAAAEHAIQSGRVA